MSPKAKEELVRQLVEGSHHFYACTKCRYHYRGEFPVERCPNGCGEMEEDRREAIDYYSLLIDHAVEWGNRP